MTEVDDLRGQLREARETLEAIRVGAVDAIVLGSPGEERVFALAGADRPYRLLVEAMNEGAATISASGVVLYANRRLGELAGRAVHSIVASPALELVREADRPTMARLLTVGVGAHAEAEFDLAPRADEPVRVLLSVVGLDLDGLFMRSLVATDLSDRLRSEAELAAAHAQVRGSEALLRTALDTTLEGLTIASAIRGSDGRIEDFRIEYVNPAIAKIGCMAVADQTGHTVLELYPADRTNGLFEESVRVVETGAPSEIEAFHFVDPGAAGGHLDQWLDLRTAKLGDGYVRSVRDVTERRAAGARLEESEYFFRETQRAASVGSYRADLLADRWESSEVLDAIFGVDAAHPRTVSGWLGLIHADDRAEMERYLQHDVIEGRQRFEREYRIVRPSDGATRWLSGIGAVGLDPDGRVVTLAGTIQDVTERRLAETEMRRLSSAIEQTADAVVITNAASEIEYVNPAFERITGYSPDEALGQNPRMLRSGVHDQAFYASMWGALKSGKSFASEMTNRRKDGSLFQEEAVISPVLDASGSITSYVAVKRDVTRERIRESSLARLASERKLIASALAEVQRGRTPEATAASICEQVLRMAGVSTASLFYFGHGGRATPLAFVRADGVPVESRSLPAARARTVRERAAAGPWTEAWVKRPWHPSNALFGELGVTALAVAPIRDGGTLFGVLQVSTSAPDAELALTEHLPALAEFAGLASVLMGPLVADLTEAASIRSRTQSIIRYGSFRSVFQPIVDASTGEHVGYEALTRFNAGPAPDVVFADARTAGLEAELELATLDRAIESATILPRDAFLSLNVSPDLVAGSPSLPRLLRKARRPVVLEITEHVPVADYASLLAKVRHFRPKVRISVDDAGSGVANFNHIVELHPHYVKLDISIIRGIDHDRTRQALVVGLLHFARESGATAIAEGVETEQELATLRDLGVGLVQGYLLARPAPAEDWSPTDPRHVAVRDPRTRPGTPPA